MKITCMVVDDVRLNREVMHDLISQTSFLMETASCNGAEDALPLLLDLEPDVLFLDIALPGISGLEFLKTLSDPPVTVITTSHKEYAAEGFDLNVMDYLVKPISRERFDKCAGRLFSHFSSLRKPALADQIFVKVKSRYRRVRFHEIYYVEAMRDFVVIHTEKGHFTLLQSLKDSMRQLPNEQFIRVHRSYIVPVANIEAIEGNIIYLPGHEIPIGESYRATVYKLLLGKEG